MNNRPESQNSLSRNERLRGRGSIATLFDEGRSGFIFPLRYVWMENTSDTSAVHSLLFTVPKRFHKRANRRNLLRRRVKEAYRLQKTLLNAVEQPLNIALVYSTKEALEYDRIADAVAKILQTIASEDSQKRGIE